MASSGVYNPEQPWQEQIDRNSVEALLQQWLPEALDHISFNALWTPKRLIQQLADGNVDRDPVVQVLARYPYLRIPPTPETETFADVPDEGSFHDVSRALYSGRISDQFTQQLDAVRDQLEEVSELSEDTDGKAG